MSQPPYPPPGGSDTGDGPAGGPQHDPSPQPYPEWQPDPEDVPRAEGGGYQGAPQYDQPQYDQPQYGQAPYGQPPHGQAPYGQPPYGQPQYGQASYGRPGVPTPPWGQGAPATSGKGNKVAILVAAFAALAIAGLAIALFIGAGSDDGASGSGGNSSIPAAGSDPEGLGDDADLDDYAEDCYDGDMGACDDLYEESPRGSAYELYGGTCAGRQPNGDASEVYCLDAFPPSS